MNYSDVKKLNEMSETANVIMFSEKKWSGDVDTKWDAPEGFFDRPAKKIASGLKSASKDLKQAMSRLSFYINRAGSNLSSEDKSRLENAKDELRKLYGKSNVKNESDSRFQSDLNPDEKIMVRGNYGFKNKPFTKKFKNMAEYEKWLDSEKSDDYDVLEIANESITDEASKGDMVAVDARIKKILGLMDSLIGDLIDSNDPTYDEVLAVMEDVEESLATVVNDKVN